MKTRRLGGASLEEVLEEPRGMELGLVREVELDEDEDEGVFLLSERIENFESAIDLTPRFRLVPVVGLYSSCVRASNSEVNFFSSSLSSSSSSSCSALSLARSSLSSSAALLLQRSLLFCSSETHRFASRSATFALSTPSTEHIFPSSLAHSRPFSRSRPRNPKRLVWSRTRCSSFG